MGGNSNPRQTCCSTMSCLQRYHVACRWFFFRVSGAKDKDLIMHLVNAGSSSFPEAWEGYQARFRLCSSMLDSCT